MPVKKSNQSYSDINNFMATNLVAAEYEINVNNLYATHFKKHMAQERGIQLPQFENYLYYHSVSNWHLSQYEDRMGLCQLE